MKIGSGTVQEVGNHVKRAGEWHQKFVPQPTAEDMQIQSRRKEDLNVFKM